MTEREGSRQGTTRLSDAKRALLKKRLQEKTDRASEGPSLRRRSDEVLPTLSFGQQRLWYLDQLTPESPVYNLPAAFRLSGRLDVDALKRGMNEIVARHEALRTTFEMDGDTPVQVIADSLTLEIPVLDLSDRPREDRERELKHFLEQEAKQPFRLAEGPLVRAAVVKLEEEEHVLFFMPHHAVFDGWSWGVFHRELLAFYEASVAGKPCELPDLPIQYADFALWQREWMQGPGYDRLSAYWREQLGGELPVLEMPTDFPRPPLQSDRGAVEKTLIPKETAESLLALGRSESATLFMVLMAAFKTLLYRYTGQTDILVGTPVAGRVRPETGDLIGFFVNTVVMRTRWEGAPSFRSLLRQVREVCLGGYSHQEMPFERLVQEVRPERDMSRNPLYQVMFTLGGTQVDYGAKMGDVTWRRQTIGTDVSQVDLTLWVRETDDGLTAEVEYCTDLFDADTIVRLLRNFNVLLGSIVENPDESISGLALLTDSERRQLTEWSRNPADFPQGILLHEFLEEQAAQTPDRAALLLEESQLTYAELDQRANQLANRLRSLGVGPGVVVAIFMERSFEMIVSVFGVLKAGGAFLPIDPEYPAERVAFLLKDSSAPVLVTQTRLLQRLTDRDTEVVCLDADWEAIAGESRDAPGSDVKPEDLAYIIYTSGSTGTPKGVMISHRAVCNHRFATQAAFPFEETDRVLQCTSLSFDAGVWEIYGPLAVGAQLVLARPGGYQDSAYLVEAVSEHKITVLQVVPSMLQVILEEPGLGNCDSLRRILCGGEAMSHELQERFFDAHSAELINCYGPTETTIDATYWPCERDGERRVVPIGRPHANTEVYVLDRNREQVPIGVCGELHIGGAQLAIGYLNRPELTGERFIPNPFSGDGVARLYRTGDIVRFLKDGSLEFFGRVDHQVKVRGLRIELGEIESVLAGHEAVKQAVVAVREDRPGDARLVAYLVTEPGRSVTTTDLRKYLRNKVPEYMVPQHLVELDALPLTGSGKVDRKRLPAAMGASLSREEAFVAPRTETERLVASVWQETIGMDRISIHDNFFDIGGHSLSSMQVIARVARKTGVRIRPDAILMNTLEQVAAEIEASSSDRGEAEGTGGGHRQPTLVRRLVEGIKGRLS